MRMYDIIQKKRDGYKLNKEEINFFIQNYTKGDIPDYQVSALMMAIYFNKMDKEETKDLTKAIIDSGNVLDLSNIKGLKVDKHSTGGVGDKTTLVVAPLVASCDIPVAKMSGRGLGFSGGTIDKLESFPGFNVKISSKEFIDNVNKNKIALIAQTENLTPADKKLYSLRDVTATVENISLIASSIMSKKIASGSDVIVLDVKVGSGAFMKDIKEASDLATQMVTIGKDLGRKTVALITDMDQPLGKNVGNILEVKEAIETLNGNGPEDFKELCVELASYMVMLSKKNITYDEAKEMIIGKINNKDGLKKLRELIVSQGGDGTYIDNPDKFKEAKYIIEIKSEKEGYINRINAEKIGKAALELGAGRKIKDSKIDLTVGIECNKKVGDEVAKNETIATIHGNNKKNVDAAIKIVKEAYVVNEVEPYEQQVIKKIIRYDQI